MRSRVPEERPKPEAARRHLGIYGHSLGASVMAIVAAAQHPELSTVVAESPFIRTRRTVAYFARSFMGFPISRSCSWHYL